MDKRHKIVPLTLAIAMTMALVLPGDAAEAGGATPASVPPVAIQTFESRREPISGNGINYEMWSCLYRDSADQFPGSTWVCNKTYENLPDGQMWNSCGLYRATTGRVYLKTEAVFNVGGIYFNCATTQEFTIGDEGVYCSGEIGVRNGAGYNVQPAPKTAAIYRSVSLYPIANPGRSSCLTRSANPWTKPADIPSPRRARPMAPPFWRRRWASSPI